MFKHISETLKDLEEFFMPRISCELIKDFDEEWICLEYGKTLTTGRYGHGEEPRDAMQSFQDYHKRKPLIVNANRTKKEYEAKLKN